MTKFRTPMFILLMETNCKLLMALRSYQISFKSVVLKLIREKKHKTKSYQKYKFLVDKEVKIKMRLLILAESRNLSK